MTPKEKAQILVITFSKYADLNHEDDYEMSFKKLKENAKYCALIAVDEIIAANPVSPVDLSSNLRLSERVDDAVKYWQQVKTEITNL